MIFYQIKYNICEMYGLESTVYIYVYSMHNLSLVVIQEIDLLKQDIFVIFVKRLRIHFLKSGINPSLWFNMFLCGKQI